MKLWCNENSEEKAEKNIEEVMHAIVHLPSQMLCLDFGCIIWIPGMRGALFEMITFTETGLNRQYG